MSLPVNHGFTLPEVVTCDFGGKVICFLGRVGGGGAKLEETEAAMTPPGELALALGVDVSSAAGGRLKSRPLLSNSRR